MASINKVQIGNSIYQIDQINDSTVSTSTTYSSSKITDLISGVPGFNVVVVQSLPATGENETIYLVPNSSGSGQNIYDEYIWVDSESLFEKIGTTDIDLDNYYNIDEVDSLLEDKQDTLAAGANVSINGTVISASDTHQQISTSTSKAYISGILTYPSSSSLSVTGVVNSAVYMQNGELHATVNSQSTTLGVPIGSIMMWPTGTPPEGWLLCNGSSISKTTYSKLFNVIGITYGGTSSGTTFNLPDFTQKFPLGAYGGGSIGATTNTSYNHIGSNYSTTLGTVGGAQVVTFTGAQLPQHHHALNISVSGSQSNTTAGSGYIQVRSASGVSSSYGGNQYMRNAISTSTTTAVSPTLYTKTTAEISIIPPFIAIYYIIKYE